MSTFPEVWSVMWLQACQFFELIFSDNRLLHTLTSMQFLILHHLVIVSGRAAPKMVISFLIAMGINRYPATCNRWLLVFTPNSWLSCSMVKAQTLGFLTLLPNDNSTALSCDHDKLHKIHPVLDQVWCSCLQNFNPGCAQMRRWWPSKGGAHSSSIVLWNP